MRPRVAGERVTTLTRWELALTEPDACESPGFAARLPDWIPAEAPGTTAQALRAAGRPFDDLDGCDVWWRITLHGEGRRRLRFDGLATICEAWLGRDRLFTSESMFRPREVEVDLRGGETLWLAFRALSPRLERKLPRARWRTRITPRQGLRGVRTTLMGRMPGWQPEVDFVGPWRAVQLVEDPGLDLYGLALRTGWDGGRGRLSLSLPAPPPPLGGGLLSDRTGHVACAGVRAPIRRLESGRYGATLELPGVEPWWPATHGAQPLHPLTVELDGAEIDLGRVGFRSIAVDRGADGDGFGLVVNGVPVFARGASWTTPDLVALPSTREACEPALRRMVEAGMNMVRLPGVGAYEAEPFFDLCDELGLMVWQDFAFANFDYPAEDLGFRLAVSSEARALLERTQLHPSLAVLCGGSEIAQQAAMMGLPADRRASPLAETILAEIAADMRPDLPYVAHSPGPNVKGDGDLPFTVDRGVAHYYGVGAYRLPIADARRANLRFASECLAFANLPYGELPPPGSEAWRAASPRDVGAEWDFHDVRDHYLRELWGEDAAELAARDPQLYLDLSRAASGLVMEQVFAEWRRPGSPTRGGLIWTLQDVVPGAGWGVLDSEAEPKAAWCALRRALAPMQLSLTDEGVNGLHLHLTNETAAPVETELSLAALAEGARPVVRCARQVTLPPRSARTVPAAALLGAFYDWTYVFRFGPPAHDAVVARLTAPDGGVLSEALYLPLGRRRPRPEGAVSARVEPTGDGATLVLETDRLVETVWIEAPGFRVLDDGFDLAPGAPRRVPLVARGADAEPAGRVRASGGATLARF